MNDNKRNTQNNAVPMGALITTAVVAFFLGIVIGIGMRIVSGTVWPW